MTQVTDSIGENLIGTVQELIRIDATVANFKKKLKIEELSMVEAEKQFREFKEFLEKEGAYESTKEVMLKDDDRDVYKKMLAKMNGRG